MKYTALILLSAFALANTEDSGTYPNGCPKDWSVEQLLPHSDCRKFYQCWDGQLVEHSCPAQLYFSVERNRCEFSTADCSATYVPDKESDEADNNNVGGGNCNPSKAPEICAAEDSDNVLVAHEKCNKYYICLHGVPVPRRCQVGLFFNPHTDQCDWPENVDCGDRVIPDGDSGGSGNVDSDNNVESGNGGSGNGNGDNQVAGGGNCDPSQALEICAAEGSDSVLIAHEKCNKYYICVHGIPQPRPCSAGLFFNPHTDQCDWPENVDCGDRVIPDGNGNGDNDNNNGNGDSGNGGSDNGGSDNGNGDNQVVGGGNCDPSQAPKICAAEGSDSVLIAHEKCNKYYICVSGIPQPRPCSAGLFFNPHTDQCDWPENVDCGDRVISDDNGNDDNDNNNGNSDSGNGGSDNGGSDNGNGDNQVVGGGNCDPSQAPEICAAEGSDSVLIAHEKCNKYYICVHGIPQPRPCSAGLFFNPHTDQCDWAENVDCGDRVIPDGNGNGDNDNNNGNGDSGNGGSDNGGSDNGNGDNQVVGGGNCDPSQAPEICAAEGSDSVLIAHEKCNKYYICVNGIPQPRPCSSGLFFNPHTDQCDWPENVDCGDRVIPDGNGNGENDNNNGNGDSGNGGSDNGGSDNGNGDNQVVGGGNCDPSQAPEICAAEGSDSVLIAHEKCNKYYICVHGIPQPRPCSAGLFFNPHTDQCDWPENVDCGDRVIPDGNGNGDNDNNNGNGDSGNGGSDNGGSDNGNGDNQVVGGGNCDPSQAPEICAAEGSDSVLIAHEKCNKYYICVNGIPQPRPCSAGLFFNPHTDQCDWPENVDCGDRVIPDGNGNGDNDNNNGNGDSGNGGSDNGGSDNGNGDNQVVGGGNCDPSQAPEICAAEGSDSVLIAHEKCNKYYICVHGIPQPRPCSSGLFFNPHTDQCDWPENVDCGDRVIPDGNGNGENDNNNGNGDSGNGGSDNGGSDNGNGDNQVVGGGNCDPSQAPEICAAEGSDSVLIAHEKCNKYYICVHGIPQPRPCSAGLFFNPHTDQCDWPENVDCGDRVIPDGNGNGDNDNNNGNGDSGNGGSDNGGSDNGNGDNQVVGGGNCDPSQAPEICAAEGSDSVLIAHEKCNKYYICVNGIPQPRPCSAGLFFNPHTDQCDWPENVDCGDRVIPDGNGNGDNDNNNGNGDSGNGGSDNGGSDNGNGDNEVVGGGNCDPSQAPEICAAEGSDSVLIAHEKCNKYYICVHGIPQPRSCSAGLFFNPHTDQCDWPDNVECGDRVIPDGNDNNESGENGNGGADNGGDNNDNQNVGQCNCNPNEAPEICADEGSDNVLVAHEKCNKFYICNHGKPLVLRCPVGLLYNPYKEKCDWPENVDCGDRAVPDDDDENNNGNGNGESDNSGSDNGGSDNDSQNVGQCNCNPNEAPEICAAEGSNNVFVAHQNCNKFFICNNGVPVTLRCPAGLHYNPLIEQCDWPENVDCGDRAIPDEDDEDNNGNGHGESDNGGSDNGGSDSGGSDNGGSDNDSQNVDQCNCNPNEAPEICAAEGSNNVLVAHQNCNKFFICNNGIPVTQRCPAGLLYNPLIEKCDWPENVDCGDRIVPDEVDQDNNGNGNGESDNGSSDNGGSDNDSQNVDQCNCNPNEAPEICAAEGSNNVLVAHQNCNKFFICNNGIPVTQRCPAGLLYNPLIEKCDWPENVDCGDRIVPDEVDQDNNGNGNGESDNGSSDNGGSDNDSQNVDQCNCNPNEAPEICAAEGSNNVLVAHQNCNKFFICNNGIPVTQRCPAGLLYNPLIEKCDWPENVDCGDRIVPDEVDQDNNGNGNGESDNGSSDNGGSDNDSQNVDQCNCNPNEAPEICAAEGSNNVLVAHQNCNKFFICNNGIPVTQRCPAGLLYNPLIEKCDWPENVDCGDRIVPDEVDQDNNGNGNGESDNGSSDNGGSDNDSQNVGQCNCNPNEAPEICAAEGSNNVLVAHQKCNKFFICHNGIPVTQRCATGLLYNPLVEKCDWPENVECGDRLISDVENEDNNGDNDNGSDNNGDNNGSGGTPGTCNCDASQAPQICATNLSDNVFIAHEKCNKYYVCANGKPVTIRCPANLFYNPYKEQCDWPENVDCTDKVNPETEDNDVNDDSEDGVAGGGNSDPSLAPVICADENANGVFVAHEICTQFYTCSNGKPVTLRCPANLLFNPDIDRCDWPHFVDCNGRIIPSNFDVSLNKHLDARRKLKSFFK